MYIASVPKFNGSVYHHLHHHDAPAGNYLLSNCNITFFEYSVSEIRCVSSSEKKGKDFIYVLIVISFLEIL